MFRFNQKAVFVTTNGYDLLLLPNGTMLDVDSTVFDFFLHHEGDFSSWSGSERWDCVTDVIMAAGSHFGKVVAYKDISGLVVVDEEAYSNRRDFYDAR